MGAEEIVEGGPSWRAALGLVRMKADLVPERATAGSCGRPNSSRLYVIECPVCPEFIDHARCESVAWEWADIHDEVEGHEGRTAYVVRPDSGACVGLP